MLSENKAGTAKVGTPLKVQTAQNTFEKLFQKTDHWRLFWNENRAPFSERKRNPKVAKFRKTAKVEP